METLDKFYTELRRIEKFNSALRIIELKFRQKSQGKNKFFFVPKKFEVSVTNDGEGWSKYPAGTRIFKVTTNDIFILLQLVKQNGKLKIVIVFPDFVID